MVLGASTQVAVQYGAFFAPFLQSVAVAEMVERYIVLDLGCHQSSGITPQTDRQTRQTDRQTGRQTDRLTVRQRQKQRQRLGDMETVRHTARDTGIYMHPD